MERHFGKTQSEQEAETEHKETPAHPSFGHAKAQKPGSTAPQPQGGPVKHAEKIPPKVAATDADTASKTPALQRYLKSLNDPNSLPTIETALDHGDAKYRERIENYVEQISKDIYSKIDARVFAMDSHDEVRKAIAECVDTVLQYRELNLTPAEITTINRILESDILGLGPLDELLADDDISDIMVDGPNEVFVEMKGQIDKTSIHFRSEEHLLNICRRIVERVGRHVDKASPICDARLPDGSRVNVILPPLALKGPTLTIRKFKKERLTLDKLVTLGTVDARTAALLEILTACRVNMLITGGTGSGKTTLLNCLTRYISPRERVITCEDAAELQLQQPQVVSLETRPVSAEGVGLVTMRDLVRNCLRMRPDRIVVGEVRGAEAFDLLQAMNTGHDGSLGTYHANSTRDAIFRLENMVAMANLSIPISAIREQIASALEVIIHTQRLRDGSRKVMNISEITGLQDDQVSMQDLVSYEMTGEDASGRITGAFRFTHLHPHFIEKINHYGLESDLLDVLNDDKWT